MVECVVAGRWIGRGTVGDNSSHFQVSLNCKGWMGMFHCIALDRSSIALHWLDECSIAEIGKALRHFPPSPSPML